MPANKYASLRYRVLDQCFRNSGRKYYWDNLAEACELAISEHYGKDTSAPSRKTIYNDMSFMKSEAGGSAPIIAVLDSGKKYYTYNDKNFSIYNSPINASEIDQLKDAAILFSRIGGLEQFEWVQEILPKLQLAADDKIEEDIISYQSNFDLKNNSMIYELFNHIRYKNALVINYKTFTNEILKVLFHPHLLKQYNNRWFLFGEVPELRTKENIHPVNFAIDRINTIKISKTKYIPNKEINYIDYFEDFIGVTKAGNRSLKITIAAHPNRYKYIASKPIHVTQKLFKLNEENGWYETSINVIPNRELYQTFLSFGPDLIILAPVKVREKMIEYSKNMVLMYK